MALSSLAPSTVLLVVWDITQRCIALMLFIPAAIIFLPAGLSICIGSPGPILIRQERLGRNGIHFRMFKLRTMVVNADSLLQQYLVIDPALRDEWHTYGRLANDPRIPGKVARLARRFSIDELPQLINVICGQMNLVGPRPLPATIIEPMPASIRMKRHSVRPGMTGYWQVSGRSDLPLTDIARFDLYYVDNRSIFLDVSILLRTIGTVITARGAY